jgi:hypothetical protein
LRGPPVLPEWPADRPRPSFTSEAEEADFLRRYSFAEYWQARAVARKKRSRRKTTVVRVRLGEDERQVLEEAARRKDVTISDVLRSLITGMEAAPPIQIQPSATAVFREPAGAIAHVRVINSGPATGRVRCWARFFRAAAPSVPLFQDEMPARWVAAPEPFSYVAVPDPPAFRTIPVLDPGKIGLGHTADFAQREEHAAAIAVRWADGSCWGWPPDAYVHGGRHPQWKLPPELLLVRLRVLAEGRDFHRELILDASRSGEDFRPREHPGDAHASTDTTAAEEVHSFRLKLVPGGAST